MLLLINILELLNYLRMTRKASIFTKIKKEAFKPLFFIKVEADTGRPGSGLVNHL